jgi:hypothetical protein
MVFSPNEDILRAAPRICLCEKCKETYGSCSLFESYSLKLLNLKGNTLRSQIKNLDNNLSESESDGEDANEVEVVNEFLLPGSVCAIAATEKSSDTVWFLKIVQQSVAEQNLYDGHGHCILEGNSYIEGKYLEYDGENRKVKLYKEIDQMVYCYLSSVVYPFVNFSSHKGSIHHITNSDFCDVISYVQHYGLQSLC